MALCFRLRDPELLSPCRIDAQNKLLYNEGHKMKKMHLLILLILVVALVGGLVYWIQIKNRLPELLSNLPTQTDQINGAFNQRITTRFPVGSMATDLTNELQKEGFMVNVSDDGSHSALYTRYGNFPLDPFRRNVKVTWKTDPHGIITEINGTYFVASP